MSWGSSGLPPKPIDPRHRVFPGPPGEHRVDKPVEKKPPEITPTTEQSEKNETDEAGKEHRPLEGFGGWHNKDLE